MKVLKAFLLPLLLAMSVISNAQDVSEKELNTADAKADYYIGIDDYLQALEKLRFIHGNNSKLVDVNFRIGKCLFELKGDEKEAIRYLEFAAKEGHNEARYYLANCYHSESRFDESIDLYQQYKKYLDKKVHGDTVIDRRITITRRARSMVQNPLDVEIVNIGLPINSEQSDYVPLINGDETMMIFTSRRNGSTGDNVDFYGENFEDIYVSKKVEGNWGEPTKLNPTINGALHDAAVGLSADGNTLIIYRTNKSQTGGDLYECDFVGSDWSEPRLLGANVNSKWVETSASVSADGHTIYFASSRPGGYGGMDIYRVKKMGNGVWAMPFNLGPTINTKYNDLPSFIDPDNHTLYFQSEGHTTIGGYDIFVSTQDDKGLWIEPENLGYPINTVNDDLHFELSSDGERGYYSTVSESGRGDQDIFVIRMPYPPRLLTIVKGSIVTADDAQNPIQGKITVMDDKGGIQGEYKSNVLTGKFLLVLNPDVKYTIIIEANEFDKKTTHLQFRKEDNVKESVLAINLDRIEVD
ncbi:MAG: PD40 domain-containing protein [Flavobacteriales bacterium]|nr:PD40 domain-containing protein [Flavobacteriales bacterium]